MVTAAGVGRPTLLDDDDIHVSTESSAFPQKMVGKQRPGRATADDHHRVAVCKALR